MNSTPNGFVRFGTTMYLTCCYISAGIGLLTIGISIMIGIIVRYKNPRLRTIRHLLMCNTCLGSIFYCLMQTINYAYLVFFQWDTNDDRCRWRGYCSYVSISAITYSYLLQALSRLFYLKCTIKYRWVTSFRTHYVLIFIQWMLAIILPLPSIITKDHYFRPGFICWVPFKFVLHLVYTIIAYYVAPVSIAILIYIYAYWQLIVSRRQLLAIAHHTARKRDIIVLRNILILFGIYITGPIPMLIYFMTGVEFFNVITLVTFILATAIEKICALVLDHELYETIKSILIDIRRFRLFNNQVTPGTGTA